MDETFLAAHVSGQHQTAVPNTTDVSSYPIRPAVNVRLSPSLADEASHPNLYSIYTKDSVCRHGIPTYILNAQYQRIQRPLRL